MKKLSLFLIFCCSVLWSYSQGEIQGGGFDGLMRSHLKFYVVAAVLGIILATIFGFLFWMERRLKKLES